MAYEVTKAAKLIFYRVVDQRVTGRLQRVEVYDDNHVKLTGCDGLLTPVQAAAARTLLDEGLAFVAERDGGGPQQ